MRKALLVFAIAIALSSCATHSAFKTEYFFQAMGEDGEIVITADLDALKKAGLAADNPVISRAERISIALSPGKDEYPLCLGDWMLYGAAEGNFSTLLVSAALSNTDGFEKARSNGSKHYTDGKISIGVPEKGVLLFTSDDYTRAKEKTLDERISFIPDALAREMAESLIAIYVKNPLTLFPLFLEIPYGIVRNTESALVRLSENDGLFYLSATLNLASEESAQALLTILRNESIQKIRREGGALDFASLSLMISRSGRTIEVRDMEISAEDLKAFLDSLIGF